MKYKYTSTYGMAVLWRVGEWWHFCYPFGFTVFDFHWKTLYL